MRSTPEKEADGFKRLADTVPRWLTILPLITLLSSPSLTHADVKRIRSVKSLTHALSQIEKKHQDKAAFVTMKMQIYLEDVYISQGTTVYLKPEEVERVIGKLLEEGVSPEEISVKLLRMYQDGSFHE